MTHENFYRLIGLLVGVVSIGLFATAAHAASDYPSAFSLWSASELDPTDPTTQGSPHCWLPAGATPDDTDTGVKYLCQALRTELGFTAKDISSHTNCSTRDHGSGTVLFYMGCLFAALGSPSSPLSSSVNGQLATLRTTATAVQDRLGALASPASGSVNAQLATVLDRLGAVASPASGSVNAQLAQLHTDLVAVKDAIVAQGPNGAGTAGAGPTGSDTDPSYVRLASTNTALDDRVELLHGDVWLVLGLVCSLVFCIPFLKLVTPWWRS